MKSIKDFISSDQIILNLQSKEKLRVLKEFADILSQNKLNISRDEIFALLRAREDINSTALEGGVAIPHAKTGKIDKIHACFGRSLKGVEFGGKNGKTHLFFVLLSPEDKAGQHLLALASFSRVFQSTKFKKEIMYCQSKEDVCKLLGIE
ncbi:MAG: PTS sugar transporter subunit IIA [Myxococcota bacterium]